MLLSEHMYTDCAVIITLITGSETTPPYTPRAAHLAQNRPQWRMMSTYGTTQQSCMPETTTINIVI